MHPVAEELIRIYQEAQNPDIAAQQSAYMKNRFQFYGLKSNARRELSKKFLTKPLLPSKSEAVSIAHELYPMPHRELHYFAMELMFRYKKQFEKDDIVWIEKLITENSWWDTVDFIADKIAGSYFQNFPEQITRVTEKWMNSGNFWLQRSALLFQLKYKDKTDTELLEKYILQLAEDKEFFIRKAIGWILREYAKTDPAWVKQFVAENENILSGLSKREALKNIS